MKSNTKAAVARPASCPGCAALDEQRLEDLERRIADLEAKQPLRPDSLYTVAEVPPRLLRKYALRTPVSGPGRGPRCTARTGLRCPIRWG